MPTILVIEDGTGVSGANSYATADEVRAYASLRGLTLPAADEALEPFIVQAADYIESLQLKFKGQKTEPMNALCWPRKCVYLYNSTTPLADDTIPDILKQGQAQLAYDATQTNLMPTGSGREVIRQKVDMIETEYRPGSGGSTIAPELNKAMAILEPLFDNSSGFALRTRRI